MSKIFSGKVDKRRSFFLPASYLLVLTSLLLSCHHGRHISSSANSDTTKVDTAAMSMMNEFLLHHQYHAERISLKAKVNYHDNEQDIDFTANIRIRHDSAIWISISLMGIEGARVLITQDSIRMIDRLHKTYQSKDFAFLLPYTSVPVNFADMENLILGNAIHLDSKYFSFAKSDTVASFSSVSQNIRTTLFLNQLLQMTRETVADSVAGRSISIWLRDYNNESGQPFSMLRNIEARSAQTALIRMEFVKVKPEESLKFPFNVKE